MAGTVTTDAEVIIGRVDIAEDSLSRFLPNLDTEGVYTDYIIVHHYENDGHVYMAGITSPDGFQGNKAAFFQLAANTLLWIADWTAMRAGLQPDIPKPTDLANRDWVLMDRHVGNQNVSVGPDGRTNIYRISGTYVYGHKNPDADVFANVEYARPPWLDPTTEDGRRVRIASLKHGLINIQGQG